MKVGFIGLGAMGVPMAENLLKGGHALYVWARRADAAKPLTDKGAKLCASPAGVGASAEVTFTIVTNGADVENVVLGEAGLIHGATSGSVVVDLQHHCRIDGPQGGNRVGPQERGHA